MGIRERIKELRLAKELSQAEFGRRLNISAAHVSNIEAGKDAPSDRLIQLLGAAFGVREDWLRNGRGAMFQSTDDILNEVQERAGEQVKIEIAMLRSQAKHYTEIMDLLFRQHARVEEQAHEYRSSTPRDARLGAMINRLERIYHAAPESTIAAIEFILQQTESRGATTTTDHDPEQPGG